MYTEAAALLRQYRDFQRDQFDRPAARDLLRETLVVPEKTYDLFELFCVFGYLRQLQQQFPSLERQRIEPGSAPIATLSNSTEEIQVFYDEGGPLSFFESYPTSDQIDQHVPEPLRRQVQAVEQYERTADAMLGRENKKGFYQGRPDFLVVRRTNDTLTNVTIGEIKYTRSEKTFSRGIRQLLEYIYFARESESYLVSEEGDPKSMSVKGVICSDGVETKTNSFGHIRHMAGYEFLPNLV